MSGKALMAAGEQGWAGGKSDKELVTKLCGAVERRTQNEENEHVM
jgi:hypothetical protein